ncbi:tetratricopeptide repeat protein [Leptospira ryugenii]|uniref:tetratricopeptide repeat protein n=1 Tax=Leptospira ryugenii TaxID=1917863 RepID=UPI001AE77E94|nr:tetratricopeptide repeat protein [Leptospira ryugenii]
MVSEKMTKVLALYNEGLSLYKNRKFVEAKANFQKALEIEPNDGPSLLYIERCDDYIADPPPEDWDGVYNMKTK